MSTKILTRQVAGDEDRRYWAVDEESGVIGRQVYLSFQDFLDLGSPETITVTVEPGDTLNKEN
jgi:hypothetical protein